MVPKYFGGKSTKIMDTETMQDKKLGVCHAKQPKQESTKTLVCVTLSSQSKNEDPPRGYPVSGVCIEHMDQ